MKALKIFSVLLLSSAVLLTACGNAGGPPRTQTLPKQPLPAPTIQTPGKLTINFEYQRQRRLASDQLAVWLEDNQGRHVRTLLVTQFTASGGYRKRAEAVPHWQKTFQPTDAAKEKLDAVSSATPSSGPVSVVWDCLNQEGTPVPAGLYTYNVEANIEWEKMMLWQGTISIGQNPSQSLAELKSSNRSSLLQNVRADFLPSS